ncbi:hypothetical protein CN933_28475 [Sinorhizobium sp. M4_45]|nr:hypothetical protein CN933_28475 [Sinorhizobium sp. M4_45]
MNAGHPRHRAQPVATEPGTEIGGIGGLSRRGGAVDHPRRSDSQLAWDHVNLTVDYLWEDKPAVDENGFRSLSFAL